MVIGNTNFTETNYLLRHINTHNIHLFILRKHKEMNGRTCLSCGQQQQWVAIPPYQLLESAQTATSQDPRACFGLPGWN